MPDWVWLSSQVRTDPPYTRQSLLGQRLAVDELEDEKPRSARLFDSINARDVRMIERREELRLPLEPGDAVVIAGEQLG